jgi:hypothetical protein
MSARGGKRTLAKTSLKKLVQNLGVANG